MTVNASQVPNGAPEVPADGETQTEVVPANGNDTVKYETYRKTVGAKKAADARILDLQSQLDAAEANKMQSEGQKDELISKLQGQLTEKDGLLEQRTQNFAMSVVERQVISEAAKMGCKDPAKIMRLVNTKDIEVDEEFNIDNQSLKLTLGKIKEDMPYFFDVKGPEVRDGVPSGKAETNGGYAEELKKCTDQKQLDAVRKKYGRI